MITQKIDDTKLVTREGNVISFALNPKYDRGALSPSTRMDGMELVMKRSPEQEKALDALMTQLHTPGSPMYHKWLTPAQFAASFGVNSTDIARVSSWLQSHGFQVGDIDTAGMWISFSGTAGQVNEAFHTEMHSLNVNGEKHIANVTEPKIPAALADVVVGPSSLHNFFPTPLVMHRTAKFLKNGGETNFADAKSNLDKKTGPSSDYTFTSGGNTYYAFVPGDGQTIYNTKPLYTAGYTGKGASIGLIEDSNDYKDSDYATFVSTFFPSGANGASASNLSTVHPGSCTNPGTVTGTDFEVELDIEYATAMAPAASVIIESCADTATVFGGLIAVQKLNSAASRPAVLSISYGYSEPINGAANNLSYYNAYQAAAALGVSVFVSSGDESSTSSDANANYARHGITVSGFTSTPYNVSVGGTDFADLYNSLEGGAAQTTYWNTTNASDYSSAKSYVPEIPWNDSCASELVAKVEGYAATYGTAGFCNNSPGNVTATNGGFLTTGSGSGGPSNCYSGTASVSGVKSGTCAGQPKPSWQAVYGNPADSVRDIPDVSLFASNGIWGHYIVICYTNTSYDSAATCSGAPSAWPGVGGTSASSPMMAGIQVLINQYVSSTTNGAGMLQGNPNWVYYKLANAEYGASGSSSCNSNGSSLPGASCAFNDVTLGDINVPCRKDGTTLYNCYLPSGTNGVGSLTTTAYSPTYKTNVGWDFATGIGSVNAYALASSWKTAFPTSTSLQVASGSNTTGTDNLTATVTASTSDDTLGGGSAVAIAGTVTFYNGTSSVGTCTLSSGSCSYAVTAAQLTPGSNSITATYNGSNAYPGSTSTAQTITQTDATSVSASAVPSTIAPSGSSTVSATVTDTTTAAHTPAGSVNFTKGSTNLGSCTLTSGACSISVAGSSLSSGANSITVTYVPSTGWSASSTTTSITVSQDSTSTTVSATPSSISTSGSTSVKAVVADLTNGSNTPAGSVAFKVGSTTLGSCTLSAGTCSITVSATSLASGSNTIVATYTPSSGSFSGSSGSTTVTVGADITFSSVSHNMGSVAVGSTSAVYGVYMTNNSSQTITYGVAFSNTTAGFFESSVKTLAPGASTELNFGFKPTAVGAVSTTWSLTGIPNGLTYSPSNGGTLTGTGTVAGVVSITTNGHNFGTVAVGSTSAVFGAVITNSTSSAVTLTIGSTTAPFNQTLNTCSGSLAAGATCNLQWTFKPTATGTVSENVSITSSSPLYFGTTGVNSMYLAGTGQ